MQRSRRNRGCGVAGKRRRAGWSLLELVFALFVVVDLLALLMPWIDTLRESGRSNACVYNLEQLGQGAIHHASMQQYYPSGGWGIRWLGDPDRGFGERQPGGWMYSILPYIGEKDLWSLGTGVSFDKAVEAKSQAFVGQVSRPIAIFYCPSRRAAQIYPYTAAKLPYAMHPNDLASGVIKSDYAINTGNESLNDFGPGPDSYRKGDSRKYRWHDTSLMNGVSFLRSEVKPADVTDGLGETYMIGEKYLNPDQYAIGRDLGDNETAMSGFDNDTNRCGGQAEFYQPHRDEAGLRDKMIWGSPHEAGFHMMFCDGSVRTVRYDIDQQVHNQLSNRRDGAKIDHSEFRIWVGGDEAAQHLAAAQSSK